MPKLALTPDELLTTTRAVRKRLDLGQPVEREVLEESLAIAQQAPTASNRQNWHFIVVTDAGKRATLADIYGRSFAIYRTAPPAAYEGADRAGARKVSRSHPRVRSGGQPAPPCARHSLRGRDAGGADSGGLYEGQGFQACAEGAAGDDAALGDLVGYRLFGRG